jgi:phosphoribosylaminoimidazole-succinocarboxamide synthase
MKQQDTKEPESFLDKLPTVRGELIGEAEGKALYDSEKPDLIIQEFRGPVLDPGKKLQVSEEINRLRNEISAYLFEYIAGFHIPTHFVSRHSPTSMVVKRLTMMPVIARLYNTAGGTLVKRFGVKEGTILEVPVIEHYYKSGRRAPSMVNEYHIAAFDIATPDEFRQMNRLASKVNAVLRGLCDRRQLFVADLQLVFGRFRDQLHLGDELSPFTCHFVDLSSQARQDRFLPDQENAVEAFSELYDRLKLRV